MMKLVWKDKEFWACLVLAVLFSQIGRIETGGTFLAASFVIKALDK